MSTMATIEGLALTTTDERSLERRFAAGEAAAFEEMVALYQGRVARLARRLLGWSGDVDDVVQDVFLAALAKARTYRGTASLWSWLTAVTLNRCRSHHRRSALFRRFGLSVARERQSPAAGVSSESDESAARVRQSVAALPVRDREVVVLFYLESRPVSEISVILGTSPNAINVRLHRARARLKTSLQDLVRE